MQRLRTLQHQLVTGSVTSAELIDRALAAIAAPDGEGARAVLSVYADRARRQADKIDQARKDARAVPPFAGIPITIKDLFDVKGEITRAGSRATENDAPARSDAVAVERLKAAGFIVIGKTNMTEFAYSGLGINRHFGTPRNAYDRNTGRIPGGSTSGGAVSLTDQMAAATIGTDTGGSCRIPAALCGIVGFKPSAARIPTDGAFALSQSLDTIGPLGWSVECCAILDAVMAGESPDAGQADFSKRTPILGCLQSYVLDGMDDHVAHSYQRALSRLNAAGVKLKDVPLACLSELPEINAKGGLVGYEAYVIHRERLKSEREKYDPWVLARIEGGTAQTQADYKQLKAHRRRLIEQVAHETRALDAYVLPSVPIIAPTFAALKDDAAAFAANRLLLRNPAVFNFLDGCAITLPCHEPGEAPVGLMIAGLNGQDRHVLNIARSLEQLLDAR